MDKLKLEIELVPRTCWFSNLRKTLTRREWDIIRKYTYGLSKDSSCMICGSKEGRLNAHEIWEYDLNTHTQKLIGLVALCDDCHMVKHIGFAQLNGKFEEAADHFCLINNCDLEVFNEKIVRAKELFDNRSNIDNWKLDISYLKDIGFTEIYNKYKNIYDKNDVDVWGLPL